MFFCCFLLINLIVRCLQGLKVLKNKMEKMLDRFENLTVWERGCVVLSKAVFTVEMHRPLVLKWPGSLG